MIRWIVAAALILACLIALDHLYYHGVYTDRARGMLREIQHSFRL